MFALCHGAHDGPVVLTGLLGFEDRQPLAERQVKAALVQQH
jgi:hypothetical protein